MRRAAGVLLAFACGGAQALPSTFGPVIGSALLCRSQLDNAYFHSYLTTAFGPSYKHEGGAFWFKGDATLWGKQVVDVMVSDDTNPTGLHCRRDRQQAGRTGGGDPRKRRIAPQGSSTPRSIHCGCRTGKRHRLSHGQIQNILREI